MSISVNAQMCSYVRALFEHPSKSYESYQENGTKYLKSRKKLDEPLQQQLNACRGEIFLCGIPPETKAEKIAEVASLVGEVYILRFKVHFSGASRGFAYLQYIDPNIMTLALEKLPFLFVQLKMPMIKVCASRNSSILLLRKTFNMTPITVYETLKKLISFTKVVGIELYANYFEYQIVFKCNEEAVHARRELIKSIMKFGPEAVVIWDAGMRGDNNIFVRHQQPNKKFYLTNQKTRLLQNNSYPFFPKQQNSMNDLANDVSNMNIF